MMRKQLFHLVLFGLCNTVLATKVPVLIWSPKSPLNELPQSYVGKTIATSEFTDKYLSPLTKSRNTVLFLQDKLSLNDLNKYADVYNIDSDGGAFRNIKSFMDDQFSVNLPSVLSPVKALQKIKETFDGKIHEIMDAAGIPNLDLGDGEKNLIIVTLEPMQNSNNEEAVISRNDQKMADVVGHLSKRNVDFTAVYTAHTSEKAEGATGSQHRHLLEFVVRANGTLLNVTGCMFWFRQMEVIIDKGGEQGTFVMNNPNNYTDLASKCSNDSAQLKFSYNGGTYTVEAEMNIVISNSTGFWMVKSNLIKFSGNATLAGQSSLDMKAIEAPPDFSYHCSKLGPLLSKNATGNDTTNITLTIDGFQLQPFNVQNNQFSDGWDCVPFFSPVIWMGILYVGLFTIILILGFTMMSEIRTMDRFDDPKGKTIAVNVNE